MALNILAKIGPCTVSIQTNVETILAYLGLTVSQIPKTDDSRLGINLVREDLFSDLNTAELGKFLDMIAAYAQPLMPHTERLAKSPLFDLVRHLTARMLENNPKVSAERIWSWVSWLDGRQGHNTSTRKHLTEVLEKNQTVRAAIIEYVLLTPCDSSTWMAGFRLLDSNLGLFPTPSEFARVLKILRARNGNSGIDRDIWRDILRLSRTKEGLPNPVYLAAIEAANGETELLADLAEASEVKVSDWEIKQAQRDAKADAERQSIFQSHRDTHTERAIEVAAGNFAILELAADIYLGRNRDFDDGMLPEERIVAFLGGQLAENALVGFMAVLRRNDLPSAAEISEMHAGGNYWRFEGPMICGLAEMIRRGKQINTIDRSILEAVFMAWNRAPESNSEVQIFLSSELEAVLFTSDKEIETYFRMSIEPQLARQKSYPDDLYRLTHESKFVKLAGLLSVDWLQAFPILPLNTQAELFDCAIEVVSPDVLRPIIAKRVKTAYPNDEARLFWLSAGYVVDFENNVTWLKLAAKYCSHFIWFIRSRVGLEKNSTPFSGFSVSQLTFIVQAFGVYWPDVDRPMGTTRGDINPWDAAEFIRRAIYAIASSPSPEATNALRGLIGSPVESYTDVLRHALALQRKVRRDYEYVAPTISHLQAIMANALPETVDDMRAYFADCIESLQERIRGSNTDMWEAYWNESQPKSENYCRNRLIEQISGQLPPSIRFEPEMHMPGQKRADIAAIRNSVGLPIEVKGQWHRRVWDAPEDQLDAKYTRDWHAKGRGVYLVLWFGSVPKKQVRKHPDDLERPKTPSEFRQMLINRLPDERRSQIDVFVVDVSKPEN